jgi:hypothetical protein
MSSKLRTQHSNNRQIRRPAAEALYESAVTSITASQLTTAVLLEAADGMDPATRKTIEQGDILERMIVQLLLARSQP